MLSHAKRESHIECCGLLAGRDGVITKMLAAKNSLNSATVYEIAPQELFQLSQALQAFLDIPVMADPQQWQNYLLLAGSVQTMPETFMLQNSGTR